MEEDTSSEFITLFTGGGILFAGLILKQIISFLAKVVIARGLGQIDYGAVSIGITILTTFSLITLLGLHSGIGRFLPRYEDENRRRGVLVSAFQISLPISIISGLSVAFFSDTIATVIFRDPGIAPVIQVFGIAIPLATVMRLSMGGIQGMKLSLPKVYVRYLTLPLGQFLFAAIALLLGFRAIGIAWAYFFAYLLASGLALYFLVRHSNLLASVRSERMHLPLLTFSLPLIISSAMSLILSDIDIFILGYYWESAQVGIYNVAYPLGQVITLPITAFGFLFLPVISDLHSQDKHRQMNRIYSVGTKWLFIITFPMFMIMAVFSKKMINIAFGAEYTAGAVALSILALGFTIHTVAGFNSNALTAVGHTRLIMYDNVAAAMVNLGLNFLLIPQYSFVGAAIATTISYVFLNILYSYHLFRKTGIHPFSRGLLRVAAVSSLLGGLLVLTSITFNPNLIWFILLLASFAITYLGILLRFGIEEEEEFLMISRIEQRLGIDLTTVKKVIE